MAYGIVIRNAAGQIVLDNNERIARQVGHFVTGTNDGALAFDAGGGQLAYILLSNFQTTYVGPSITVSGNVISWSFGGNPVRFSVELLVLSF